MYRSRRISESKRKKGNTRNLKDSGRFCLPLSLFALRKPSADNTYHRIESKGANFVRTRVSEGGRQIGKKGRKRHEDEFVPRSEPVTYLFCKNAFCTNKAATLEKET